MPVVQVQHDRSIHRAYQCPKCGNVSFSAGDIIHLYCGHCHAFEEERAWQSEYHLGPYDDVAVAVPVKTDVLSSRIRRGLSVLGRTLRATWRSLRTKLLWSAMRLIGDRPVVWIGVRCGDCSRG